MTLCSLSYDSHLTEILQRTTIGVLDFLLTVVTCRGPYWYHPLSTQSLTQNCDLSSDATRAPLWPGGERGDQSSLKSDCSLRSMLWWGAVSASLISLTDFDVWVWLGTVSAWLSSLTDFYVWVMKQEDDTSSQSTHVSRWVRIRQHIADPPGVKTYENSEVHTMEAT